MTFADENTLGDIFGLVVTLDADLDVESPEFPMRPRLDELITRVEDKLPSDHECEEVELVHYRPCSRKKSNQPI